MRQTFKNRGHFCNYFRKVLENKQIKYKSRIANALIWFAWKSEDHRDDITSRLLVLPNDADAHTFNLALEAIQNDYKHFPGYGTK